MKEYKITKERLEAMAKKCPEAKEILKEGFPEAFEKEENDITQELTFEANLFDDDEGYYIDVYYCGRIVGHIGHDVVRVTSSDYKIVKGVEAFKILKRRSK